MSKPPRVRVFISCTKRQFDAIHSGALKANTEVSTFVLAKVLGNGTSAHAGDPVIISGDVADRLRAFAETQGIAPSRALEQLLVERA